MLPKIYLLGLFGLIAPFISAQDDNKCKSYGVDFRDGGVYYQNSLSTVDFNFTQYFVGTFLPELSPASAVN
jgi:hypothetical protein